MQTTLNLETDKTKAEGVLDALATASKTIKSKPKYNTKKANMLRLFINLGERGINCFESANSHHDYVLRTTVSDLQLDYGLEFSRKWEQVPNAFGGKTDCLRYWLDDVNKAIAQAILGNEGAI